MKNRSRPAPSRATLRIALLAALAVGAILGRSEDPGDRRPSSASSSMSPAALPS